MKLDLGISTRDLYAANRGGGLYSEAVSQWLGAALGRWPAQRGLSPAYLTLGNLFTGCLAAVAAIGRSQLDAVALGIAATLMWQVAYALDCADGQVARTLNRGSREGAQLDVLCDFAVQVGVVVAVAVTAKQYSEGSSAEVAVFASTWFFGLIAGSLDSSSSPIGIVGKQNLAVKSVKIVRDYGFVVLALGIILSIFPEYMIWFMRVFYILNGLLLLATCARLFFRASRR